MCTHVKKNNKQYSPIPTPIAIPNLHERRQADRLSSLNNPPKPNHILILLPTKPQKRQFLEDGSPLRRLEGGTPRRGVFDL